jgi:hypothetical protein
MTCHAIRSFINKLPVQKIFCTRDVLHLSTRANVDQTLFRLTRRGLIQRLARGVYVRDLFFKTSAQVIATARAIAFGKKIAEHPVQLLKEVNQAKDHPIPTFSFWGRPGLFCLEPTDNELRRLVKLGFAFKEPVRLTESCARKMSLAESKCGRVMHSIWHLKKENCTAAKVTRLTDLMVRSDEKLYHSIVRFIPAWLSDYFYLLESGQIRDTDEAEAYWLRFKQASAA